MRLWPPYVGWLVVAMSVLFTCGGLPAAETPASERPNSSVINVVAGMGIMVGEVTATSALAQVRLTSADKLVERDVPGMSGVLQFELQLLGAETAQSWLSPVLSATAERDFIVRQHFPSLKPGTTYRLRTRMGIDADKLHDGPTATFRTLPGVESAAAVKFVVVTGMNYAKFHGDERIDRKLHVQQNNTSLPPPYAGPDKHLGYPALATIQRLRPDFFVGTGDNVYYDTPTKPRAETVPQLRQKWHEQFVQPRFRDLFAVVPTFWMIDDHDYRIDDGDNTGDYLPTPETARQMMLEQLPVAPADDQNALTYRTHRVSRDLQVWFTENRMYRSPNAMPDGPEKSIWGAKQKAWLKRTLSESDATFKLLISPNPMIGPDDARKSDNHTNIGGFRHERDEFFHWVVEQKMTRNFFILCGDRHWQYHSVDPLGLEEFSCGALVDANSRLGRSPGDPKSTDPDARIKQVYTQSTPSGGFLMVESTPATADAAAALLFRFQDEQGEVLYEHRKTATVSNRE